MNPTYIDPSRAGMLRFHSWIRENASLQPSELLIGEKILRLEMPLIDTDAEYIFRLTQEMGGLRPMEERIAKDDLFFVESIGLYVTKADVSEGTGTSAKATKGGGKYPLFAYPDSQFFVGKSGNDFEYQNLEAIYNGTMTVENGTTKLLPKDFLTINYRKVPENTLVPAANGLPYLNGFDIQNSMVSVPSNPTFLGSNQASISVRLPKQDGGYKGLDGRFKNDGTEATTRNILVLLLKGHIAVDLATKSNRYAKR